MQVEGAYILIGYRPLSNPSELPRSIACSRVIEAGRARLATDGQFIAISASARDDARHASYQPTPLRIGTLGKPEGAGAGRNRARTARRLAPELAAPGANARSTSSARTGYKPRSRTARRGDRRQGPVHQGDRLTGAARRIDRSSCGPFVKDVATPGCRPGSRSSCRWAARRSPSRPRDAFLRRRRAASPSCRPAPSSGPRRCGARRQILAASARPLPSVPTPRQLPDRMRKLAGRRVRRRRCLSLPGSNGFGETAIISSSFRSTEMLRRWRRASSPSNPRPTTVHDDLLRAALNNA